MIRKEGLYLGWRWSQASGAVEGRCSGEATQCRQTRSGEEYDRGRRGTPARLRRALLCKKRTYGLNWKFWQNLPYTVRFLKPAKKCTARWPITTYAYALDSHSTMNHVIIYILFLTLILAVLVSSLINRLFVGIVLIYYYIYNMPNMIAWYSILVHRFERIFGCMWYKYTIHIELAVQFICLLLSYYFPMQDETQSMHVLVRELQYSLYALRWLGFCGSKWATVL